MKSLSILGLVLGLSFARGAAATPGLCYELVGSRINAIKNLELPASADVVCLQKTKPFMRPVYWSLDLYSEGHVLAKFATEQIKGKCFNMNCDTFILRSGVVASLGQVGEQVGGSRFEFNEVRWQLNVDGENHNISKLK